MDHTNKKIDRRALKQDAKALLSKNYWKMVLAGLIMTIIGGSGVWGASGGGQGIQHAVESIGAVPYNDVMAATGGATVVALVVSIAVLLLLWNPLEIGCSRFFVKNGDTRNADLNNIVFSFSGNYGQITGVMALRWLYTFLWSLLFVIPGIVKNYEYLMIPYLLAENPTMSKEEAFETSRQMMRGHKWQAFVLDLSFIGWHILGIVTFGIVEIFYVAPYYYMTRAELYRSLRADNQDDDQSDNPYVQYGWA